jgi:transcriptional regulator with XRE-family HTH domain
MLVAWDMKSNMRVPTGRLLAAARHAAGLKQAELAHDAGIDQTTLSRMEGAGLKTIGGSNRKLQSVLDALRRHGVEVDEDSIRIVKRRR